MPMIWNAQADAQLLAAVIQVYDVKVAGSKLNDVAALMGPECTAKALTHRLAKIRQLAKADPNDASVQEANGGGKKGKGAGVLGAPKNGRGKKAAARAATPTSNDDEDDTNGAARTPPPTGRPERNGGKKRDYAALAGENDQGDDEAGEEDDAGGLNKKVKIEVGEDVGEGLRQTNEFEEKLGEMEQGGDIFA